MVSLASMQMRIGNLTLLFSLVVLVSSFAATEVVIAKCPASHPEIPSLKRRAVYDGVPFKAHEVSTYDVSYLGVPVGHAWLRVKPPTKYKGSYQRVFSAEGKTGKWYRYAFVAHDKVQAFSRPQDFAIQKFYMSQKEGALFGKQMEQEKWLNFNHTDCLVTERIAKKGSKEEKIENELEFGASDSLGAIFKLRTKEFKMGVTEKVLVYTSEKNWWLEATPVKFEKVKVPAGTFESVKLKLQTYIGKDLQQKGDVYIWIATEDDSRPLLKIKGDIKIGSVDMVMKKFKKGR